MSQTDFLRELDSDIVAGLKGVGMADAAIYTPPGGGAGVPCNVLVDRAVAFYGEDGISVAGFRNLVTLFLDDVAQPARGATVEVDGELFKLDQVDARDESMSRWVVIDG